MRSARKPFPPKRRSASRQPSPPDLAFDTTTFAMESFTERVRRSCVALKADEAWVDTVAVERFAKSLDVPSAKKFGESLASSGATHFDLSFKDQSCEVNLITFAHAVDFGSGFRKELHAQTGKGAWLSIKDGIEAVYRKYPTLSASVMTSMTVNDIEHLFHFPATRIDGRPTGLAELSAHLTRVINELGVRLAELGFESLDALVFHNLQEHGTAAALVQRLVEAFPVTFDDRHTYPGWTGEIYLYKKAQLVVGELYHRFRHEDSRFDFADAARMTAFVDNVVVATLRKLGVVCCTPELAAKIEKQQPLPAGSRDEVALRAKALEAVELVVATLDGALTPVELCNYLWGSLGKSPEFRKYERHATKDTVFY